MTRAVKRSSSKKSYDEVISRQSRIHFQAFQTNKILQSIYTACVVFAAFDAGVPTGNSSGGIDNQKAGSHGIAWRSILYLAAASLLMPCCDVMPTWRVSALVRCTQRRVA